jgi:hypothetical protein
MVQENVTLALRKMKYIWMKVKAIRTAGVAAIKMLWHSLVGSVSKYCANSKPEYIIEPTPKALSDVKKIFKLE